MFNYLRRLFFPAPQPVSFINHDKIFRKNNMALKNTNSKSGVRVSPTTLSNNLVTSLEHLSMVLSESCSTAACAVIFAAARQIRITAREAGIQSRFDRQVNQSEFAGVFNDYDYNFTKWSNGIMDPVRDPRDTKSMA
jgi:hypothetical protein